MNDLDPVLRQIATLNPVPREDELPSGAMTATALLANIDELTAAKATPTSPAASQRTKRRWPVAVVAAAAVLVLVGGAALLLRVTGSDSPVATTPPADTPSSLRWSRVPHDEAVFGGPGDQEMESVTAGGPGLVAVGSVGSNDAGDAAVWTSVDGVAWSRVPHDETVFGGPNAQRMLSVTAGGPGLVAVGADGSFDERHWVAAVWTSVDGITWSRVPHDDTVFGGADSLAMTSVTVGGPGLVAVGDEELFEDDDGDAAVWTSVDGITWSRVPHDESVFGGAGDQGMNSVTVGGPGLVAVGVGTGRMTVDEGHVDWTDTAAVWISADGITWSRIPHDEAVFEGMGSQQMSGVTVGGPGLMAVGSHQPGDDVPSGPSSHAAVWTSVDGITWSLVRHDTTIFGGIGGQRMASVTVGGPGLVAVGNDGGGYGTRPNSAIWTSVDGINWSRVPHDEAVFGGTSMSSVTVAGPGLVAVGHDWLSKNGYVDAVVWVATSDG